MSKLTQEKLSKSIAYALRHKPEEFGLAMSTSGWVSVSELAKAMSTKFQETITIEQITQVVTSDSKGRYVLEKGEIRATQGHSFPVELGLAPSTPPGVLYHGTVSRFLRSIFEQGLISGSREYVHLSAMKATATQVAARRGTPVLLEVNTTAAIQSGVEFFLAENGVWLARAVPASAISIL